MEALESNNELLLDGVKDPIDRLYKVSTWIRNPSSRFASSKALQHKDIDTETEVDLVQAYEPFEIDYVASVFSQHGKQIDRNLTRQKSAQDDKDEAFLVRRIARSNVQRRQQFAYWKKHREKLNQHAKAVTNRPEFSTVPRAALHGPLTDLREDFTPLAPAAHSVTTASQLRFSQLTIKEDKSQVSVSEYAPSMAQVGRDVLDFPPAPKLRPGESFFECPYCFTICSKQLLNEKAWK